MPARLVTTSLASLDRHARFYATLFQPGRARRYLGPSGPPVHRRGDRTWVEAKNFRRVILELDRRFPDLGHQIDEGMAVAIDGEIYQDAYLAPLNPDSEINLI